MARHQYNSNHSSVGFRDSLEWEELPSFADSLTQRLRPLGMSQDPPERPATPVARATVSPLANRPLSRRAQEAEEFNTAWNVTMPAELDELPPPQPFSETLQGLAMREVNEPEVFRHFFG
jgi:hypothetical protein